jgi:hypothetical protein
MAHCRIFGPCASDDHSECVQAYFDDKGDSVACACACHKQREIFPEHKIVSVQRDLFSR